MSIVSYRNQLLVTKKKNWKFTYSSLTPIKNDTFKILNISFMIVNKLVHNNNFNIKLKILLLNYYLIFSKYFSISVFIYY